MIQLILLQLFLTALTFAAPLSSGSEFHTTDAVGYGTGGGIVGLIVLVLDVLVFSKYSLPIGTRPY